MPFRLFLYGARMLPPCTQFLLQILNKTGTHDKSEMSRRFQTGMLDRDQKVPSIEGRSAARQPTIPSHARQEAELTNQTADHSATVPAYRAYLIGATGRISSAVDILADTDEDASARRRPSTIAAQSSCGIAAGSSSAMPKANTPRAGSRVEATGCRSRL